MPPEAASEGTAWGVGWNVRTEIQRCPVAAKPLKEPPQITTIYGRTKGETEPKTTDRSKSQRLALLGRQKPEVGASRLS